jgi:hypothetical protein
MGAQCSRQRAGDDRDCAMGGAVDEKVLENGLNVGPAFVADQA